MGNDENKFLLDAGVDVDRLITALLEEQQKSGWSDWTLADWGRTYLLVNARRKVAPGDIEKILGLVKKDAHISRDVLESKTLAELRASHLAAFAALEVETKSVEK